MDTIDKLIESEIIKKADSFTYIVVIPTGFFGDESYFEEFQNSNALDILALTQEYIFIVKKKCKREITDTINRSLIIRAKEKALNL